MAIEFKHTRNKADAFNVRAAVFMVEQGFTYDFDMLDEDDRVIYITAYDAEGADPDYPVGEYPIGTARIFPAELEWQFPEDMEATEAGWVVGRIAVRPEARHLGLGSKLLAEAERIAAQQGGDEMHLHAQVRAMDFYHRNGYAEYGAYADDEGVAHQWMKKPLH